MVKQKTGSRSFGMFRGVFIPTFLTIIGVILYLRLGRIVGEAGIFGTLAIILLAVSVTFATGMSLSSITTNIRIGAGGAFSILSRTLGIEIGGSVGIPLYLAQTLSVVLYIFGFMEAWKFLFPDHPSIIILYVTFLALFVLTFINVKYAIRAQVIVFAIVLASLVSIFAGGDWWNQIGYTSAFSTFPSGNFWALFALFFPAVTGLMAGVGMSGELTNPKKQIPTGVMTALGITTCVYIAMTFWYGYSASTQELLQNNLAVVKLSFFGPLVLLGILAATFSSALTTFVAAPRLLQAMSEHSILPYSNFLGKKTQSGEPRIATISTGIIVMVALALGSLDSIASILTMFFLITYAMINLVVFVEQSLGLVSFRPTFRVPKVVPFYGAVLSLIIMFLINTVSGIIALSLLFIIYLLLVRRKIAAKEGYVRSGLFLALSEWAARKVMTLAESPKHIWKPNVLLPVVTSKTLLGNFPFIKSIVYPNGTLSVLGMGIKDVKIDTGKIKTKQLQEEKKVLPNLVDKFGKEGIFSSYAYITAKDYTNGVAISLQAMEGQFFHPNILFLPIAPQDLSAGPMQRIVKTARNAGTGLVFFDKDEDIGVGSQEDVHIWVPQEALDKDFYEDRSFDLALLIAYRLYRNWVGKITLWMCVDKKRQDEAKSYLRRLIYEARLPGITTIEVSTESFLQTLRKSPQGDIHIIPFKHEKELLSIVKHTKKIDDHFCSY